MPDRSWYDPVLNSMMHTGRNATEAVVELIHTTAPETVWVATDIETPGLKRQFEINCVTASWQVGERMTSILLDPDRTDGDDIALRSLYDHAGQIILHNAPFDIPGLVRSGHLTIDQIDKVLDTLVLARFAEPDSYLGKKLEQLASRHLGMVNHGGMSLAFKAAGYNNEEIGYANLDIDAAIYRQGAMADTAVTLKLAELLIEMGIELTLDHPFASHGAATRSEAEEILAVPIRVHQIMLKRTARGMVADLDYLHDYADEVADEREISANLLAEHGLEGGAGKGPKIVVAIEEMGELPEGWPRTKTGKLKATKELLDDLDHPLATAQRHLADTDRILGYLDAVRATAAVTGRCHPQCGTLGASTTGRMSYAAPPLQQFSARARPILTSEEELWSIDWSQIEPVTMANMAHDVEFLAPFEAGEDLYEPIMLAAGIDRPLAKAMLLATMYGQGIGSLARRIGHTQESAQQIKRQMLSSMPKCARFMTQVTQIAETHGRIVTVGGRILPVDPRGVFRAVNYICQGSAADVMNNAIIECDRAGLGDHINLAMHDELVISGPEEVAIEVERIMQQPPERLADWAQRTPVLRTDRQSMNHSWQKV
ncbi:DNA polymerase I [Gordonia phage Sour]|uniref:DNA polymerase I n=1 Tax=Gordonia phage Sour TaxID=2182349 RepID=A0A2U8UKI9_9CAUD|nr:DNA polymerase I [Gordonia phage Sour]AWN04254.1 DNA polymerase I [Gordonia phage Sour]